MELELAALEVAAGGFTTVAALGAGVGASGDSVRLVLKGGWLTVAELLSAAAEAESAQGLGAPKAYGRLGSNSSRPKESRSGCLA